MVLRVHRGNHISVREREHRVAVPISFRGNIVRYGGFPEFIEVFPGVCDDLREVWCSGSDKWCEDTTKMEHKRAA